MRTETSMLNPPSWLLLNAESDVLCLGDVLRDGHSVRFVGAQAHGGEHDEQLELGKGPLHVGFSRRVTM